MKVLTVFLFVVLFAGIFRFNTLDLPGKIDPDDKGKLSILTDLQKSPGGEVLYNGIKLPGKWPPRYP